MNVIKEIANKLFSRKAEEPLTVSKSTIGTADAALIVDPQDRPGLIGGFLLKQAGGPDPKYTFKEEARDISKLAFLKFASVSLVTFSAMKALSPVFDNPVIASMPEIANTDPKTYVMGATSVATWWMFSQLDAAVMNGLRDRRTARYLAEHHGVQDSDAKKGNYMGLWYRFGISAGSLAISLPALWIAMSEHSLDDFNRERHAQLNAPIVARYQGELDAVDALINKLREEDIELRTGLTNTISIDTFASPDQLASIKDYEEKITKLEEQISQQQEALREQERLRDEAQIRADWEEKGVNGAKPGRGKKWKDAMADVEAAKTRITSIEGIIAGFNTNVDDLRTKIEAVNTQIDETAEQKKSINAAVEEDLRTRIDTNSTELAAQIKIRESIDDVQARAEADVNYNHMNADMIENSQVYVQYMLQNPNILTWGSAVGLGLLISCAELLVFYQTASKKVSPAEERAAFGRYLNSAQARDIFSKKMMEMGLESNILDTQTLDKLKKRTLQQIDQEIFEKAVEQKRSSEEILQEVMKSVEAYLKEISFRKERDSEIKVNDTVHVNGFDRSRVNVHGPADGVQPH